VVLVVVLAATDVVVVVLAESANSLPLPSTTKTAATAATIESPTIELMMVVLGITLRENQKLANGSVAMS
ncbi:MAG: hypothetical protein ACI9N0_003302, partial [Ilumatobacter sp.]